jgi:hypothetical protein
VGDKYGPDSCFGIGILILGESHYGKKGQDKPDFTKGVLKGHLDGSGRHPFFTKVGGLLFADDDYPRAIETECWKNLAFCNFLQYFKGSKPKGDATKSAIEESCRAFYEVIERLEPDLIISAGKTMWNQWLPDQLDEGLTGQKISADDKLSRDIWRYETRDKNKPALCGYIIHPSAGGGHFKKEEEREHVKRYIEYAKEIVGKQNPERGGRG